jgi:hypothetical protein
MAITVASESPLQDDIRVLIAELNAMLLELTPRGHVPDDPESPYPVFYEKAL